jgi:hypothetical protein
MVCLWSPMLMPCQRRGPLAQMTSLEPIGQHLAPFGMQNRKFDPYLAAIHRILISAVHIECAAASGSRSELQLLK